MENDMEKNWRLERGSKHDNMHKNSVKSIEKTFKHCRQGSIKTRIRYEEAVKHFAKFLVVAYNKQSMNNIENKHLESYVEQMQEIGYSASYITTNLSAIRFFVDQDKDAKYIKSNEELGVIPRGSEERIGPSRSWTQDEIKDMQSVAIEKGFERVADIINLAHLQGLRIHEVTRLERNDLKMALKNGSLTVKGKGGLVRNVPLRNQDARDHLQKLINQTSNNNSKVFVNLNEKTHEVIKQVQNFIANNRQFVQETQKDSLSETTARGPLTAHGLRHTYANQRYFELRNQGKSDYDSRLKVSHELGHFRVEITNVYIK